MHTKGPMVANTFSILISNKYQECLNVIGIPATCSMFVANIIKQSISEIDIITVSIYSNTPWVLTSLFGKLRGKPEGFQWPPNGAD